MGKDNLTILAEQNPWWKSRTSIVNDDRIVKYQAAKFKKPASIVYKIDLTQDVIYSIRGPRQIGKTTLIKLIIKDLITKGTPPEDILFFSCESCTRSQLNDLLQTYLDWREGSKGRKYIFLDEVCSIEQWNKEVLHFCNKGAFKNCSIIVSGSHAIDLKEASEMLPGRKGEKSEPKDKVLLPMKFSEFAVLLYPDLKDKLFEWGLIKKEDRQQKVFQLVNGKIPKEIENLMIFKTQLDAALEKYLLCGGIPKIANEFLTDGKISSLSYETYLNAIMGDLNRWKLKPEYSKRIVRAIYDSYCTPVSWNEIKRQTDIGTHATVEDYVKIFDKIFFTVTINLITQEGKINYVKNKKVYIQDPFIFHAFYGFVNNTPDKFEFAKANLLDSSLRGMLVETVVLNHLCRFAYGLNPHDLFDPADYLFFYRDSKDKEIDFILNFDKTMYPFEVKFQQTIVNEDYVAFRSFKKGLLISKDHLSTYNVYSCVPASVFLMLI